MAAIRDRMEDHAGRPQIRYTQVIVNHGREAGASLEHPHGQLLGIPFVPGEIAEEEAGFRRFEGSCLLCTTLEAEEAAHHRVVYADDRVVVVCPFWSGTPFEMLVLPRAHEVHVTDAAPPDVAAVGRALRDVLAKLRATVGDVAYNLVFHTAPHRHAGPYHWHVHVLPRLTSVAGFEQGTGRDDRHRLPRDGRQAALGRRLTRARRQPLREAAFLGAALDAQLVPLRVGERGPPGPVGSSPILHPRGAQPEESVDLVVARVVGLQVEVDAVLGLLRFRDGLEEQVRKPVAEEHDRLGIAGVVVVVQRTVEHVRPEGGDRVGVVAVERDVVDGRAHRFSGRCVRRSASRGCPWMSTEFRRRLPVTAFGGCNVSARRVPYGDGASRAADVAIS